MNSTIKSSVQRLRTITSANIGNFILGFCTCLILVIVTVAYELYAPDSWKINQNSHLLWQIFFVTVFAIPVLTYSFVVGSAKLNGITQINRNVRHLKRNLFISIGFLWASMGALTFSAIGSSHPTVALVSASLLILSWISMNKIIINYVTNY